MKSFPFLKSGIILCILITISSCLGMKPGGGSSGKKLYETFFVGEEGTQYFIKPLLFCNKLKEELKFDMTFRYKSEIKDSAVINITLISKEIVKNIDSLQISSGTNVTSINEAKYMFCERDKETYICRFSTKVKLSDVEKLFDNNSWNIILYKQSGSNEFTTPNSTKKSIEKINYEIFSMF